jgi:hypothetical protein
MVVNVPYLAFGVRLGYPNGCWSDPANREELIVHESPLPERQESIAQCLRQNSSGGLLLYGFVLLVQQLRVAIDKVETASEC